MNCDQLANLLTEFLEGDLDGDAEAEALDHLSTCTSCEAVLAETREVVALAAEHGRVTLDRHDRDRMLGSILSDPSLNES